MDNTIKIGDRCLILGLKGILASKFNNTTCTVVGNEEQLPDVLKKLCAIIKTEPYTVHLCTVDAMGGQQQMIPKPNLIKIPPPDVHDEDLTEEDLNLVA